MTDRAKTDPERMDPQLQGAAKRIAKALWDSTARYRPVLALVIGLVVFFSVTQPTFLTSQNIQNTLSASSVLWVVAMGATFVMVSGGADISVGALVALDGVFLAKISHTGAPQGVSIVAMLVFGVALGAVVNGGLIGRFQLSFLIVTLATMTTLTGVVNLWTGTNSVPVNSTLVNGLGSYQILGIQATIWIMVLVFVVALYVQKFTYIGRDIYATGGNPQAASLSGIRTVRAIIVVYGISGLAAAIAAIMATSQVGVASNLVDNYLPLGAIAAVVLGGAGLAGGVGGVQGTLFGVLFLAVLANGLSISGVPGFWQQVLTGAILIVAVLANSDKVGRPAWLSRRRDDGAASLDGDRAASAALPARPGASESSLADPSKVPG